MESEITRGAVQSAVGVGQIGVQVIAQDRGDRRLTTTLPGPRGNLAHDLIPSALHADHARREIHVVAEKGGKLAAAQARVDRGGPHGGILRAVELGEHRLDRRGPRAGTLQRRRPTIVQGIGRTGRSQERALRRAVLGTTPDPEDFADACGLDVEPFQRCSCLDVPARLSVGRVQP